MNPSITVLQRWEATSRGTGRFTRVLYFALATSTYLFSAEASLSQPSIDQSFPGRLDGSVEAMVLQPDGRLLVAGEFSGPNLVRFTREGFPDATFAATSSVPSHATSLALQSDGKVLVGNKGGVDGAYPAIGLSRFLSDGSPDQGFKFRLPTNSINNGRWSGFWTTALTVQPDGKILLAGHYERDHFDYSSWSAVTLQRLLPDGSEGESFALSWPAPSFIGVLVSLPDQRMLVAGDQLARLNADGTEDTAFVKTILSGGGRIYSCIPQSDGRILVGGSFTNIQGHARCRVARLLPNGQLDLTFNPPVSTRENGPDNIAVRSLALQADGRILVGGDFEALDGRPSAAFARLNPDGSLDTSFPQVVRRDSEADNVTVRTVVIQDGAQAFMGGADLATSDGSDAGDLFRIHLGDVAPRLFARHIPGGTMDLTFLNPGGHNFTVLKSTNLNLPVPDWTVLGPATKASGDLYRFTAPLSGSEAPGFYRLQRLPSN